MRLFRLTFATIFQRKAWVICLFAILVVPFALPMISTATEKPILMQPARIQAAWSTLWVCALIWGLFTASREGETNAKTGIGEYFQTTGMSPTRQLLEIWLAMLAFIVPLAIITGALCYFTTAPADAKERAMWLVLNAQYVALFLLVVAPLLALSTALASRFGGITGFAATLGLTLYGLYGVGYLDNMLKVDENPLMRSIWVFSPHYHFADLTQRLYFKSGALPMAGFWAMTLYFSGILAFYLGLSRLCFRTRAAA